MGAGRVELVGADILCSGAGLPEIRIPAEAGLARLADWSRRYDDAQHRERADPHRDRADLFIDIGREMFAWLDEALWASAWAGAPGDRELEIHAAGRNDEREAVLLDAPWELLADASGPLTADTMRLFVVARRIGSPTRPVEPRHDDLLVMFMAASPIGQRDLDYEAEEVAILKATRDDQRTRLVVEETGALGPLGARLTSSEGPFDAVHLSCHVYIDKNLGPVLLLQTLEGVAAPATPGDLMEAFGEARPPLLVLSASRTAEWDAVAAPLALQLATFTPNVVGWDGSVYDHDATAFAAEFYQRLGRRASVARAVAHGRRALWRAREQDPRQGRHWHLARLYLGPGGGGPLCAADKPSRPLATDTTPIAFLDARRGRVPVASREAFVGRRRALQAILGAFRRGDPGVLIHGMAAAGKSSAAARISNRLGWETGVIFGRYDALAMFDEILGLLPARDRGAERDLWREGVRRDGGVLAEAVESWLRGPLNTARILLIIDDLESILNAPAPGDVKTGVQPDYRISLGAILTAFSRVPTRSRLLITSRYDFSLPDGRGGDLAAFLVRQPLAAMAPRERVRQLRAAERLAGWRAAGGGGEAVEALLDRALRSASGIPGLQAVLVKPILAGELAAAREALDQIAVYLETGAPPAAIQALIDAGAAKDSKNALIAFFARLSFARYRAALTADEGLQLSAATLFDEGLPIPRAALAAAGAASGCEAPGAAIDRLIGHGLLDDWGDADGGPSAAINALARPLATPLDRDDRPRLARAALVALAKTWTDRNGYFPADPRGAQAATLALECDAEPALLENAVLAGAAWLEREGRTREALALIATAHAKLPDDYPANPRFLRLGVECANQLGEAGLLDAFLSRARRATSGPAREDDATLDIRRAERLVRLGRVEEGEAVLRSAHKALVELGSGRAAAIAAGAIADIHYLRGEYEEALRIRHEEELPVYERLGDERERAVTMGKIADIHYWRGEYEEALRIRHEEELPVYDRVGDERSRAVTMGQISDIHYRRGEYEEALRIRREEELPVYERLGDVRSRAVTMGRIADIHYRRGEYEEALRIRQEEQLPVYERLGDVRSLAVAMGKIADIYDQRGDYEEALRIRYEKELPVYERLGDIRSRAVTMGKIADTHYKRGEYEEALRIRHEETLPVYERLGEVHSRAVTMGQIADIRYDRGEYEEALRIRREEELPVYERLGDVRSRALTMGQIADIHDRRGEYEEALRIRREEVLPVFKRLRDARERSVTLQKIATELLMLDGIALGRVQEIYDALMESFEIAQKLGLPDRVASSGHLLAQVMATRGLATEALAVLDEVEAAFRKLDRADGVASARELRGMITDATIGLDRRRPAMEALDYIRALDILVDHRAEAKATDA